MIIWLRSAVYNLYGLLLTLALLVPGIAIRLFAPERSLALAKVWGRGVLGGARVICGVRFVVEGRENLPRSGPALIASRHESAFDTFVWLQLVPQASYIVKQELVRVPLLGPLMPLAGMIPVDRGAGAQGLRRLAELVSERMRDGRQVVIFPEGTRVDSQTPVVLQPGLAWLAARTGAAVIPVATDSGRYWGRRAFLKRPGTIRVVVRKPLPPGMARAELLQAATIALTLEPVENSVGRVVESPAETAAISR